MLKVSFCLCLSLLIGLFFALESLASSSKVQGADSGGLFENMDTDASGSITWQEYSKAMRGQKEAKKQFEALDQNHDGVLDRTDSMQLFKDLDLDGNKKLDKEELANRWKESGNSAAADKRRRDLRALDINGDGFVTYDEFQRNWVGVPLLRW